MKGRKHKTDMVNCPPHYATDGIECIDAMIASQGGGSGQGPLLLHRLEIYLAARQEGQVARGRGH